MASCWALPSRRERHVKDRKGLALRIERRSAGLPEPEMLVGRARPFCSLTSTWRTGRTDRVLDQGPPRAGTAVRGRHEQHLDPGPFDEHEGVRAPRPIAQAKDRREARQFLPD